MPSGQTLTACAWKSSGQRAVCFPSASRIQTSAIESDGLLAFAALSSVGVLFASDLLNAAITALKNPPLALPHFILSIKHCHNPSVFVTQKLTSFNREFPSKAQLASPVDDWQEEHSRYHGCLAARSRYHVHFDFNIRIFRPHGAPAKFRSRSPNHQAGQGETSNSIQLSMRAIETACHD